MCSTPCHDDGSVGTAGTSGLPLRSRAERLRPLRSRSRFPIRLSLDRWATSRLRLSGHGRDVRWAPDVQRVLVAGVWRKPPNGSGAPKEHDDDPQDRKRWHNADAGRRRTRRTPACHGRDAPQLRVRSSAGHQPRPALPALRRGGEESRHLHSWRGAGRRLMVPHLDTSRTVRRVSSPPPGRGRTAPARPGPLPAPASRRAERTRAARTAGQRTR